jgi:hypothetical protein
VPAYLNATAKERRYVIQLRPHIASTKYRIIALRFEGFTTHPLWPRLDDAGTHNRFETESCIMLRPATPLSVLLFAAFVLLLISVLSTPIIKQIPLASFGGVDFGVFGFCQGNRCSKIEIGYSTSEWAQIYGSSAGERMRSMWLNRSSRSPLQVKF